MTTASTTHELDGSGAPTSSRPRRHCARLAPCDGRSHRFRRHTGSRAWQRLTPSRSQHPGRGRRWSGAWWARRSDSPRRRSSASLGVDQPDFGVLFDDMEFLDGQDVPVARCCNRRSRPRSRSSSAVTYPARYPAGANSWPRLPMRCGTRDRRQRDHRLEDHPRGHRCRQRLLRPVRAR